jgi:SAM-dependent methyltransferase
MAETKQKTVEAVKEHYGAIARGERSGCGCGSKIDVPAAIGYSKQEIEFAGDANLGLGCGNPMALEEIREGMTVLDLGSGAGFDAFLAWQKVGATGKVIGVDMTDDMLQRARENAKNLGATNVEFRKGQIEALPIDDSTIDLVISNCVINLSTAKEKVFAEIARVLKPGGRFAVSDIVLLEELPEEIKKDVGAYVGCLAGASTMGDYVKLAVDAGLKRLQILEIQHGSKLAEVLAPEGGTVTCCGSSAKKIATQAVASIKLHGSK